MTRPERQQTVLDVLRNLRGLEPLKQLLWSELNYQRVNRTLSRRGWSSTAAGALAEDPALFATAGSDEDFHVIYARLASDRLPLGQERPVVSRLLRDHPYALFVFSNAAQDRWHFVNVKPAEDPQKRRLFRRITVGPEERLRTASERLALLDLESIGADLFGLSPLAIQQRHDEAFDVEAVTKLFFDEYQAVFHILQDDLGRQTKDRSWAHDYALQFLNRCMFLYFIQRKQWLGDDTEFLQSFWHAYQSARQPKDSFAERWLKVLFFEAFNDRFHGGHRQFPDNIRAALAEAPFLNGGLFSPNDLDRQYDATISDTRWEQVLKFLDRYNFTIAEDSPLDQEVAVDPEMIGKVYETLVNVSDEADERGDAGIFYTPRTEIDLMCRLALVDNLANHVGAGHKSLLYQLVFALEPDEKVEADAAVTKARLWPAIDERLRATTAVDPACGSGSFLVGMLHILDDLQERTNRQIGRAEAAYDRKKRIIGQSLYGVDVMDWACHVAELRLWLALIIDAEFTRQELHVRGEPLLPHFSFKIRCGDSLVQEVGGINLRQRRGSLDIPKSVKDRLRRLQNAKLAFYANQPNPAFKTKSAIKGEEVVVFRELLGHRISVLDQEAKKLMRLQAERPVRQMTLDGGHEPTSEQLTLDREAREAQIAQLMEEKGRVEATRDAIRRPQDVPFVWDIAFAEVMESEAGGFDIVIGNPPYVRQENISDPFLPRKKVTIANKRGYKVRLARSVYETFPRFFGYKPVTQKASRQLDAKSDLYVYFYFIGLSILNERGSFCFITSNSWLDVGYGAGLQEFLLKHCHVKLILDNRATRSFASAHVNTVIALLSAADDRRESGLENTARFVMFKIPFEQALSAVLYDEIEGAVDRNEKPEYRELPLQQRVLFKAGCEAQEPDKDADVKPAKRTASRGPLIKCARYIGDKWGGKYLRAPDIYWTILRKGSRQLVPLRSIAEVRPGCYAGINDFFYLSKETAAERGIEPDCLRPLIRTSRDVRRPHIVARDIDHVVFFCPFEKAELKRRGLTGALKYIVWGEQQVTRERQKTAAGIPWPQTETVRRRTPGWWSIPSPNVEPARNFLLYVIGERFLAPWSDRLLATDRCFHRLLVAPNMSIPLAATVNSTLTFLLISLFGRGNLGQGAQKYETADAKRLMIVDPKQFGDARQLREALDSFGRREVLPINDELRADDRCVIDDIAFAPLRLTQTERDGIYEAVLSLVEARLNKADSLKPQDRKKRVQAASATRGIWAELPPEEDDAESEE